MALYDKNRGFTPMTGEIYDELLKIAQKYFKKLKSMGYTPDEIKILFDGAVNCRYEAAFSEWSKSVSKEEDEIIFDLR